MSVGIYVCKILFIFKSKIFDTIGIYIYNNKISPWIWISS